MSENNTLKHTVYLENREVLDVSGVIDVESFNEEEIRAKCEFGELLIKGSGLHVEALEVESGNLKVRGKIAALLYSEKLISKGFLGKILS